jgi:hypothetical protein
MALGDAVIAVAIEGAMARCSQDSPAEQPQAAADSGALSPNEGQVEVVSGTSSTHIRSDWARRSRTDKSRSH